MTRYGKCLYGESVVPYSCMLNAGPLRRASRAARWLRGCTHCTGAQLVVS